MLDDTDEGGGVWNNPLKVHVLVPEDKDKRAVGVFATSHKSAMRVTQRYPKPELDYITKWAGMLGITQAAFIRGAAVNMARALEEQYNADRENNGGGSGHL